MSHCCDAKDIRTYLCVEKTGGDIEMDECRRVVCAGDKLVVRLRIAGKSHEYTISIDPGLTEYALRRAGWRHPAIDKWIGDQAVDPAADKWIEDQAVQPQVVLEVATQLPQGVLG